MQNLFYPIYSFECKGKNTSHGKKIGKICTYDRLYTK